MRVILAGATGTLGEPLIAQLRAAGHEVIGITRSDAGVATLKERGASAVVADVMDREVLLRAIDGVRADAVIHELTALKKAPATFGAMRATNRLRIDGSLNLVEAAHMVGATKFITQSIVFGYGYAALGDVTEQTPFGLPHGDATDAPIAAMVSAERQAFEFGGVALRYGLFYGRDIQSMKRMLNRRSLPVPSRWRGTMALIHHDDAAAATVAALERGVTGHAYNIVDETPISWHDYIQTVAAATAAARPLALPDGLVRLVAPYAGAMMTRVDMRVSNELAKRELGWAPRYPSAADGVLSRATV
jgi:nucleoside-diphosphate-sugar epimerase